MSIFPNALFRSNELCLLERIEDERAAIVYLDPPRDRNWINGEKSSSISPGERSIGNQNDHFEDYLYWLSKVIQHAYRITKKDGNVVIHTDLRINSYIRIMMEELYPGINFTEIILRKPSPRTAQIQDNHELLLFCRKTVDSIWKQQFRPLTEQEIRTRFVYSDNENRRFTLTDLTTPVSRISYSYEWRGFVPSKGSCWRFPQDKMENLFREGRIYIKDKSNEKFPYLKNYADEAALVPIGNDWDDIPLRISSSERISGKPIYLAQEPLSLLDRVIKIGSNENDLIIDPFCGSGTTIIASQMLSRKWIACDSFDASIDFSIKTLNAKKIIQSNDYLLGEQKDVEKHEIIKSTTFLSETFISRKRKLKLILNQPVSIEETKHYEFKEVKGNNPVGSIENTSDEYAVAFLNAEGGSIFWGIRNEDRTVVGVSLSFRQRDDVRKAVDNKLSRIQPAIALSSWKIIFHQVSNQTGPITDLFVVELIIPPATQREMFYGTDKGEVFVKTESGKQKLSLVELQQQVINRQKSMPK